MDKYDIGMFNFYNMSPGKTQLLNVGTGGNFVDSSEANVLSRNKTFNFKTSEQSSVKVEYHEISSNSLQQGLEREYDVFCLCVNLADEEGIIEAQIRDSVDTISQKGKLIFLVATKADLIPNSELSDKIAYLKGLCAGINSANPVNNIIRLMFITSAKNALSKKLNLDITTSQKVSLVKKNKPLLQVITEIVLLNRPITLQANVCSTPPRRQAPTLEVLHTPVEKKSTPLKCFTATKPHFSLFSQKIHTTKETIRKLEQFAKWDLIPSEEEQASYLKAYKENQSFGITRIWSSYGSNSLVQLNKLYSDALINEKEIKGKEILACLEPKYKRFLSKLLANPSSHAPSEQLNGTQAVLLQLVKKYMSSNEPQSAKKSTNKGKNLQTPLFLGSGVKMGVRTQEFFRKNHENRKKALAKPAKKLVYKEAITVSSTNSSFL